jgi:hypothetical protein
LFVDRRGYASAVPGHLSWKSRANGYEFHVPRPFPVSTCRLWCMRCLSSQDAVQQFCGKQMVFYVHLDICYKRTLPERYQIKVIQNKKEIAPLSAESSPYVPSVDELATLPANGERIRLEFKSTRSILPPRHSHHHA